MSVSVDQKFMDAKARASWKLTYEIKVTVEVSWPGSVKYKRKTYYFTGKEGVTIKTGVPSAEYADGADRLWLDMDGSITPD